MQIDYDDFLIHCSDFRIVGGDYNECGKIAGHFEGFLGLCITSYLIFITKSTDFQGVISEKLNVVLLIDKMHRIKSYKVTNIWQMKN